MNRDEGIRCWSELYPISFSIRKFGNCDIEKRLTQPNEHFTGSIEIVYDPLEYGGFRPGARLDLDSFEWGLRYCTFTENTIVRICKQEYRIATMMYRSGKLRQIKVMVDDT